MISFYGTFCDVTTYIIVALSQRCITLEERLLCIILIRRDVRRAVRFKVESVEACLPALGEIRQSDEVVILQSLTLATSSLNIHYNTLTTV